MQSLDLVQVLNSIIRASPFVILAISAICLIFAYNLRDKRTIKASKMKKVIITFNRLLERFVEKTYKKKNERLLLESKLRKVGKIDIYTFTLLKLVCFLSIIVLSVSVYITNRNYEIKQIIEETATEESGVSNTTLTTYYNSIKSQADIKKYSQMKKLDAVVEIRNVLFNTYDLTIDEANNAAVLILNALLRINSIYMSEYYYVFILLGYLLPNFILSIVANIKDAMYERDLPIVKTSAYLLAAMYIIPIRDILKFLSTLTNTYKPIFNKTINEYTALDIGAERSLKNMCDEAPFLPFRKLCIVFRDMLIGNSKRAVENLAIDISQEKRETEIKIRDRGKNRQLISMIFLCFTLFLTFLLIYLPSMQSANNLGNLGI